MNIVTSLLVALATLGVVAVLILRPDRRRRGDRLSAAERRRLARALWLWPRLDNRRRGRLLKTTARVRRQVSIMGGDGLALDAEQRLLVAAQVALCSLAPDVQAHRLPDEIVVYPVAANEPDTASPADLIEDLGELATGESWATQRLTVSWPRLEPALKGHGPNPLVRALVGWRARCAARDDMDTASWLDAFEQARANSTARVRRELLSIGADAELALFVGVAAEAFFQHGDRLAMQAPALYDLLAAVFDLDTAAHRPAGHRSPAPRSAR